MSYFTIDLSRLKMSEKQVTTLNRQLRKTTIKYLQSYKEGQVFLKNSVEYKPHPDDPDNPPIVFPPPPKLKGFELERLYPRFPGFFPLRKDILNELKNQLEEITYR